MNPKLRYNAFGTYIKENGSPLQFGCLFMIPVINHRQGGEMPKIIDYSDKEVKPIEYTMASPGMRIAFWDCLRWSYVSSTIQDDKLLASGINVYTGEGDGYLRFITQETLFLES